MDMRNQRDATHAEPAAVSVNIPSDFSRIDVPARLKAQLLFMREVDALKETWRNTLLITGKRFENDAEHSWEMALMATVLAEYAPQGTQIPRVMLMLLIHDLVEIDAGDTYAYDAVAAQDQHEREQAAAERIFNLLPVDQAKSYRALWEEFEARETVDARFARAMDRLQPLLHSYHTHGRVWAERSIKASQVRKLMHVIGDASPALGELADRMIADAIDSGFLEDN
ncbi:HD domain-containing protein [Pandoraea sputorum]|uniref:Phosphohydrolase n=1 Tax=Pandoraea sputorum TaxID=93222 RepID=A0A5E5AX42_9BURK|nr:HD domain-containing protein [Pandoraea sputorum]VVE77766.1 phosphohydrolase [Pandoraea sputorum]